jgi:transcriptional regulator
MEASIETIQELKNLAYNKIKIYCEITGENFADVKNALYQEADPFNLKLPYDFYLALYKLSLTLRLTEEA